SRVSSASAVSRALRASSRSTRAVAASARVFTSSSNKLARTRLSRAISSSGDAAAADIPAVPSPTAVTNAKVVERQNLKVCGRDIGDPPNGVRHSTSVTRGDPALLVWPQVDLQKG
ncbi:hypothetical protein J4G37_50305, partial [Microvirga sp. 3-52]|nr:hypothetical protein [Microvirga sp. 3-52]